MGPLGRATPSAHGARGGHRLRSGVRLAQRCACFRSPGGLPRVLMCPVARFCSQRLLSGPVRTSGSGWLLPPAPPFPRPKHTLILRLKDFSHFLGMGHRTHPRGPTNQAARQVRVWPNAHRRGAQAVTAPAARSRAEWPLLATGPS
jgi:hypothetical protein